MFDKMYLYCFIYNLKLSELKQLFTHLKCLHSLKLNSLYTCCMSLCNQHFSLFCSFSKHMKKKCLINFIKITDLFLPQNNIYYYYIYSVFLQASFDN